MAISADSIVAPASSPAPISLTAKGERYVAEHVRGLDMLASVPGPDTRTVRTPDSFNVQTSDIGPSANLQKVAPENLPDLGRVPTASLQSPPDVRGLDTDQAANLPLEREAIETSIQRHLDLVTALIAVLDQAEPDPDLEPALAGFSGEGDDREGGDVLDQGDDDTEREPSLGWTEMEARYGCQPVPVSDCELDASDDEPNLGAPEPGFGTADYYSIKRMPFVGVEPLASQASWARGRGDDHETSIDDQPHDGELDEREGDGLEYGEADPAEGDSGEIIRGGNERVAL